MYDEIVCFECYQREDWISRIPVINSWFNKINRNADGPDREITSGKGWQLGYGHGRKFWNFRWNWIDACRVKLNVAFQCSNSNRLLLTNVSKVFYRAMRARASAKKKFLFRRASNIHATCPPLLPNGETLANNTADFKIKVAIISTLRSGCAGEFPPPLCRLFRDSVSELQAVGEVTIAPSSFPHPSIRATFVRWLLIKGFAMKKKKKNREKKRSRRKEK